MKRVRSYTSIWSVEKVLYAINDLNLPFPITFTQMTWFVVTLSVVIVFSDVPPLGLINGAFLKYLGIPAGITWFMSQKTFDNKKPLGFLRSVLTYVFSNKFSFAYQPIKLEQKQWMESITCVTRRTKS